MVGSVISGSLTKAAVAALNFVVLILSSRYLGAATRGEISLYLLNIGLVQLVNEVYTGYSLVHFIPRSGFRQVVTGGLVSTAILCPLTYLVIVMAGTSVEGYEWLGFVTTVLVILNTFNCILLLGRERVREYNMLCLLQPGLLLAGMCYTILVDGRFVFAAFCWPLLFSFAVAFCYSTWLVVKLPATRPAPFAVGPVIMHGIVYQATTILFLLSNRYSYFILSGKEQLGIYAAAVSMMDAALVLSAGVAPVLISRVANSRTRPESAAMSLTVAKSSLLLTTVAALVILCLPDAFFIRVLGQGFAPLRNVMIFYMPGMLLLSFITALSAYFTACGRQRDVLVAYAAGFLVTFCLAPFLVRAYGMQGAAITADISYLVMGVFISVVHVRTTSSTWKDFFGWRADLARLRKAMKSREG